MKLLLEQKNPSQSNEASGRNTTNTLNKEKNLEDVPEIGKERTASAAR